MKDLSQLTAAELQAELNRRNEQKESDRKAYKDIVNQELTNIIKPLTEASNHLSKVKLFAFESLYNAFLNAQKDIDYARRLVRNIEIELASLN